VLLTLPLLCALAFAADSSTPQFTIDTVAGSDAAGDNSLPTLVPLLQPEGVAVSHGNVYFADALDNRIRVMGGNGTLQTVAGTGRPGFSGDGGPAKSAQLNRPYSIALDSAGNLYVADLGNARVRRIDIHGIITTVAGGGTTTLTASAPAGIDALTAQLISPRNVATAPDGSLYISDFDGQYVYRLDAGGTLTIVTGTGVKGFYGDGGDPTIAQVAYPAGLAVRADGSLYVADSGNARVRKISDGVITTVAQVPEVVDVVLDASNNLYVAAAGILGNPNSPVPDSDQLMPRALALTPTGNILFSSGSIIQAAEPTGLRMTIAGLNGAGAWGDGGPATLARFAEPAGCALDAAGNLYIADTGENRIREVTPQGVISTVYGTGDAATLNGPRAVAIAADGSLLIADTGNGRVLRRNSSGAVSTLVDHLSTPSYLFPDPDGDVYIAETEADRVTRIAQDGSSGFLPVVSPVAVVRDAQGSIYIAQSGSPQIMRFDPSGWGAPFGIALGRPSGLSVDANGNLLVADAFNNDVASISPSGVGTTLAGAGPAGFAGDGGPSTAALLSGPSDVKVDSQGRVFIVDSGNNRIRMLTPHAPEVTGPRVVSAASFASGPVSPDEIVCLFGTFDPSSVTVQVAGEPATLFYAGASQINVLIPHDLRVGAPVNIAVLENGVTAQTATMSTARATPALFTVSGSGTGQAAALNQDNTVNSDSQPIMRGSVIVLYGTGYGADAISVTIGGEPSTVQFAGPAPNYPGLMQVNVTVPADLASSGDVGVTVAIGETSSQPGVTITVQ